MTPDDIATEHGHRETKDGDWECKCGVPIRPNAPSNWMHKHLIAVTEAAVREQVARDILEQLERYSCTVIEDVAYDDAARIARGGAA